MLFIHYKCLAESNHFAASLLRQQKFLTSIIEKLGNPDESKVVVSQIEEVRKIITNPSNIVLHMAANLENLPALVKPDDPVNILSELLPSDVKPVVNT